MCPVCTVAVGVGLGLSRWLKIDDSVSGVWIGAFIVSLSAVSATFTRKYISLSHKLLTFLFMVLYLAVTIIPFWYYNIIGHPKNSIFGVDKLIFGISLGIVVFYASHGLHLGLKKKNNQRSYIPFQKVIIPLWILIAVSVMLSLLVGS